MVDNEKGIIIVVSGPSGVGKGTVNKKLINSCKNIDVATSVTTRQPRDGEIHGREYFFSSVEDFEKRISNNEFVEYANVHGNYYGTLVSEVENRISKGKDVILEIDVQGGKLIKEKFEDCVTIFVLPPSLQELSLRLNGRATDDKDVIEDRLKTAIHEIECIYNYDYFVINNEIKACITSIKNIIKSEKQKVKREKNIIEKLLNGGTII